MACSRVVPRSTPPSTIKFVPRNALLISGQGEPITTRDGEATMLRAFGQLTDLRTHWASHRLWAIRRTKARTSPAARPGTAPHPRPGSRPRFEDHAVAGSVRR